ncbi:MAG TPA: hypothetical protein ENI12_04705 [Nitrospirae bacterium]|nr:hypothetical protein [Nitrospirota bacterium]
MRPHERANQVSKGEGLPTKLAYLGVGVGIGLFAIFGLLNASFIGGILGINIVGSLFGYPIPSTLLARAIIAFGMLTGVMVAGLMFTIAGMLCGWLAGVVIVLVKKPIKAMHENHTEHK